MPKIAIINYNMGNLASVANSVQKVGYEASIVTDPSSLGDFDKLILPGVGAFPDAMEHLNQTGMSEGIKKHIENGKPLLGICLGMQLLFQKGYEHAECDGLGVLEGEVKLFDSSRLNTDQKVPHMGWNRLKIKRQTPIFEGLEDGFYLYFVHSYHAVCPDDITVATAMYGYEFAAVVQKDNIYGIQPHPEKSGDTGLRLLKNFLELK